MKNFILIDDFKSIATDADLAVLSDENEAIIKQCNLIAIHEAIGYLNQRYDVDLLFDDPLLYSLEDDYVVGERVYNVDTITGTGEEEYTHYTCILDAPAGTSIDDTTYFVEIDDRDQKLLEVVMSMSLFYIHKRLTPNNIPEFRVLSYDGNGNNDIMSAIKWLTMIQEGKLNPYNWPIPTEPVDPDIPEPYDILGNNPADSIMWQNDMGEDYHWYNNQRDKNIIIKTDDEETTI